MEEEIPDLDLFMMCPQLNRSALIPLPDGYHVRSCRKDELPIWKAFPFDNPTEAKEYEGFMTGFFHSTYGGKEEQFYQDTLFICDEKDQPIATCLLWKAYGLFNTIHWLKVLKGFEGRGIGRALLSIILQDLPDTAYPIYLHTQPGSYRAIKLYSDFGFKILTDPIIGTRTNDWEACKPYLQQYMPTQAYARLQTSKAPNDFIEQLKNFNAVEF
ncbi:MAG: GNAT family N-acetyltransferase [Saprospiraceae bacterium]|nr:GNAT family N-acetyltransferase [Saprospiraceae bacterium]